MTDLSHILRDTPVVIDVDKAFDESVKQEADVARRQAVMALVDLHMWQNLQRESPDHPEIADYIDQYRELYEARQKRAVGIQGRAGVSEPSDLPTDMRLFLAGQLSEAQRAQVILDEKEANSDLYALTAAEAAMVNDPRYPPPETEAQIRMNALQGRAKIRAIADWLAENPEGGEMEDSPDAMRQKAVDAARKFYGGAKAAAKKKPKAENSDISE